MKKTWADNVLLQAMQNSHYTLHAQKLKIFNLSENFAWLCEEKNNLHWDFHQQHNVQLECQVLLDWLNSQIQIT